MRGMDEAVAGIAEDCQVRLGVVRLAEVPVVDSELSAGAAPLTDGATLGNETSLHPSAESGAVLFLSLPLVVGVRFAGGADSGAPVRVVSEGQPPQPCRFPLLGRPC